MNKEQHVEYDRKRREVRQDYIRRIKQNYPCTDCGARHPHYMMEFDHRDPSTKIKPVSYVRSFGSMQSLLNEIGKCDLVCANCHKIRTYKRLMGL